MLTLPFAGKRFSTILRLSAGLSLLVFVVVLACGCAPALIGAGAAGGYTLAKSEKSTGEVVDDAWITTKVKSKLLADTKVRGLNIDVDTNLGVVTFNGIARSQEEIDRAVQIAKDVEGVKGVKSNLKLKEE